VVGGEGDVVAVDDTVGTDVAHVAGGVEWREVGVLLLLMLLLRIGCPVAGPVCQALVRVLSVAMLVMRLLLLEVGFALAVIVEKELALIAAKAPHARNHAALGHTWLHFKRFRRRIQYHGLEMAPSRSCCCPVYTTQTSGRLLGSFS